MGWTGARAPSLVWEEIFFFAVTSRMALEPTKPHKQWVLWVLSPGMQQSEHEADHSPPSSARVKNT